MLVSQIVEQLFCGYEHTTRDANIMQHNFLTRLAVVSRAFSCIYKPDES